MSASEGLGTSEMEREYRHGQDPKSNRDMAAPRRDSMNDRDRDRDRDRDHRDRDRDRDHDRSRYRSSRDRYDYYNGRDRDRRRDYRGGNGNGGGGGGGGRYQRDDRQRYPPRRREDDRYSRYPPSRPNDRYRERERDRERDRDHQERRQRSRSPRPREPVDQQQLLRREPPVDLENVVPINERQRQNSKWDVKPRGFDKVTNAMAKMSGLFPKPGHPKPVDANKLAQLVNEDGTLKTGAEAGSALAAGLIQNTDWTALKPSRSRLAKRILVTGFDPLKVLKSDLVSYFTTLLGSLALEDPGNGPIVVSSRVTSQKDIVQLDLQTAEQATVAVAFSGCILDESNPSLGTLEIFRPDDYITPEEYEEPPPDAGYAKLTVPEGPNKICISNIPIVLSDDQIQELLKAFGEIKSFKALKDKEGNPKGIAFCEYVNPELTSAVIEGFNGTDIGGSALKVVKANAGIDLDPTVIEYSGRRIKEIADVANERSRKRFSSVLQLLNMVTNEELADDREYNEIMEDIQKECQKYGELVDIYVPRPNPGTVGRKVTTMTLQTPGVGKIFVKFNSTDAAQTAMQGLNGKRFSDRTTVAAYYSESNFNLRVF